MTPQQAKRNLHIIQAFANGEAVQSKNKLNEHWENIEYPNFDSDELDYRIAPKEIVEYLNIGDYRTLIKEPLAFWSKTKRENKYKQIKCTFEMTTKKLIKIEFCENQ